jgi:hypothetical protein
MKRMKTLSKLSLAALSVAVLAGCAVVPVEPPVAYGPPVVAYGAPAATVVVRPAPRYYGYYGGRWRGYWH